MGTTTVDIVAICIAVAASAALCFSLAPRRAARTGRRGDEGKMHVPRDGRTSSEYLGDWVGRGWRGQAAKELHVVHASRAVINGYRGGKRFRHGGALV